MPTTIPQLEYAFRKALEAGCKIAGIYAGNTLEDLAEAMAYNLAIQCSPHDEAKDDLIEYANKLIGEHFNGWSNDKSRFPHDKIEMAKTKAFESFIYYLNEGAPLNV